MGRRHCSGFFPVVVVVILVSVYIAPSVQLHLPSSQIETLLQLRKLLEYPKQLDSWRDTTDLCNVVKSESLALSCTQNSVTEIKIIGDKAVDVSQYEGGSVPGRTMSSDFSVDSFVATLARLSSLRVVILVSLGIWGPLPDKIHRLYSLEVLDLSSNFLYGAIPPKISEMGMLQTLTLDGNFFTGSVPDSFGSLSNFTGLSLKNNRLKGPLPRSIGAIRTLTSLSISGNNISGDLPDLTGMTNLEVLDLRENNIKSELPEIPKTLITVLLSKNSISGRIPDQFKMLNQIQHLDLSFNLLTGAIPPSLLSLPKITYLNLESNRLIGSFPKSVKCSKQLSFVDISDNQLAGSLPSCLGVSNSNKRVVKFSGNCMKDDPKHQHNTSYCSPIEIKERGRSEGTGVRVLIGLIAGVLILLFLFMILFCVFCKKRDAATSETHLLHNNNPEKNSNAPDGLATELLTTRVISQPKKHGTQVLSIYRVFSLEELQVATNGFDQSSYMGEGSIGKVYKGRLENGTLVAIKCLSFFKKYPIRNLNLRLNLLSKLKHPHLVSLLGHCTDNNVTGDSSVSRVFLVYEFMSNGNLHLRLSESLLERLLKWPDRLTILIGIAKAVRFLHTGIIPGFFNNKLRTSNILLDQHLIAKISDYGLSIITEEIDRQETRANSQKHKYPIHEKSPEWIPTNLDDDIYMFGVILLETIAGPSLIAKGEAFFLTEFTTLSNNLEELKQMLDPVVVNTCTQESLSIIVFITVKCLSPDQSFRPSIEDVLWNLQYAAQVQTTADSEQMSDATSINL